MTRSRTTLASQWPPNAAVAAKAGHQRLSPLQAIRRKCLDCSAQQVAEVRLCETVTCPLWPFRAGRHPYTRKGLQEADSEASPSRGSPMPGNAASSGITLQEASFEESEAIGRDNPDRPCPSQERS